MPCEKELAIYQGVLRLLSYLGAKGLPSELEKAGEFFPALQKETAALILQIAALGQQEGILGDYSQDEIIMAFTGVFSALSLRLCNQSLQIQEPSGKMIDSHYRMLVRSLAP